MRRSSLQRTEFEQFKLQSGRLFRECGEIRGGRYIAQVQDIDQLKQDHQDSLQKRVDQLVGLLSEFSPAFDDPGSGRFLYDPGRLHLIINADGTRHEIDTSVDSISEPNSSSERAVLKLARAVRAAGGGILCGNAHFYGIDFER